MNKTLITKDSKGKIRVAEVSCEWDDVEKCYTIRRNTYQYGGKITVQPEIYITKGKVKRTIAQQAELEFNSHVKKYLDKGYKEIEGSIDQYTKTQLDAFLPEHTTDANGFKKHMLAKDFNKVATSVFDKIKVWYGSRKIDGVRCSFYWKDGEVKSASRGGGDYNFSTSHLRNHPKLIEFLKNNPEIVFDGELYCHGYSLQALSGLARTEKDEGKDCSVLEYYIYDIMIPDMPFSDRLYKLDEIQEALELGFEPNKEWGDKDLKFQMVPQVEVSGWASIKKLHNQYVAEGFEGIVVRNPDKPYGFGKRTNDMIKVKEYQDAEFEITGLSEGLRDEDMCFTCITDKGIEFKAKPMGNRELKQQYRENLDNLIGKMATVKFFYYSEEGTPLQPVLKCIRDYE